MSKFKLYSLVENHDVIFEIWGGSTWHCDELYRFSDFHKTKVVSEFEQIPQWLFECASRMTFPSHALEIVMYALNLPV